MAKIYIIAGEYSGDFIGSKVIEYLKQSLPEVSIAGIGGPLMQQSGINSLFPMAEINIMGFVEIIPRIFRIIKLIRLTVENIVKYKPDILVTIDSPGFTFKVAQKIRKIIPGLKMVHIVAPSVWAYKPKRAEKYAKIYNQMLALLPFEPMYFTKWGLDCKYIGHPILEQNFPNKDLQTDQELTICVTVGSRRNEILRHAPIFVAALNTLAQNYSNLKAIFVLANQEHQKLLQPFLQKINFNALFSQDKMGSFAHSHIALAKSGTNILEIAAMQIPMVIAYRVNILSYLIIKTLIKIKYVSLVNITANQQIIPEFLQFNCNAHDIALGLSKLLENPISSTIQVENTNKILYQLGLKQNTSPSKKAAQYILELLNAQ